MKRLAIIGASGHGKVVAEIAELNGWLDIVFFDDDIQKKSINNWEVKGDTKAFLSNKTKFDGFFVAIGNNHVRKKKTEYILSKGANNLISLRHPSAIFSKYSKIGLGSIVMAGAVVNSMSKIGMSVIINTNSTIEHDNLIQDYVHISPGVSIAGKVSIAMLTWVGIGSSIKQNISIGSNVTIGAGSAVVKNVKNNVTVFGVPAKSQLINVKH
jgi:sugar O-acyltransferase (sialic acid O-acetyltransferase NeuD family)